MMNSDKFSITLPFDPETVLALFSLKLASEGFHVAQSFEIESACASFTDMTCPHTGKSPCDCQLVVLLAYRQNGSPIPLIFHGHAGQTEVSIEATSRQPDLSLIERVQAILQEESDDLLEMNG